MSSSLHFNRDIPSGSVLSQLEALKGKLYHAHLEFSWRGRLVTFTDGEQIDLDHLTETVIQLSKNAQSYQEAKAGCSAIKSLETLYMFFDHAFKNSYRVTQLIHKMRTSGLFGSHALAQEPFEGPRGRLEQEKAHLISLKEATKEAKIKKQPRPPGAGYLGKYGGEGPGETTLIPLDHSMAHFQQLPVQPVIVRELSGFEIYPDDQRFTITNLKFDGTTLEVLVNNPDRPIEDFQAVWVEFQNTLYLTGGDGATDGLYTSRCFLGTVETAGKIYQSRMSMDLSHILENHDTIHVAEHMRQRMRWDGRRWVVGHLGGPIIQFTLHKKD